MGYGSRCQAQGLNVSRTTMQLGFSHSIVSRVYQECPPPKGHHANLTQMWEALESTWARIPVERFRHLFSVHTFHCRLIEAVLRAEVGATQY